MRGGLPGGRVCRFIDFFFSSSSFTAIAIFIANFTAHPLLSFPTRPCVSEGGLFPSLPPPPTLPPSPYGPWLLQCGGCGYARSTARLRTAAVPAPPPPLPPHSRPAAAASPRGLAAPGGAAPCGGIARRARGGPPRCAAGQRRCPHGSSGGEERKTAKGAPVGMLGITDVIIFPLRMGLASATQAGDGGGVLSPQGFLIFIQRAETLPGTETRWETPASSSLQVAKCIQRSFAVFSFLFWLCW